MAINATDTDDRVDQLIVLTDRLTTLIAQEALAFEARRPHEAARHVDETAKLANLYRHESMRVRHNPALIAGVSAEKRRRLIRATEAFDAVLARQGRAIEAAKTITEGLVRVVAEEIANQRGSGVGYGPSARAATQATAITLNRRA